MTTKLKKLTKTQLEVLNRLGEGWSLSREQFARLMPQFLMISPKGSRTEFFYPRYNTIEVLIKHEFVSLDWNQEKKNPHSLKCEFTEAGKREYRRINGIPEPLDETPIDSTTVEKE